MTLPADYVALLNKLAGAFEIYYREHGTYPVLVGGGATAIQTAGKFMSGDLDVVAGDDEGFRAAMLATGFFPEERVGRLFGGYYHPAFPRYGVEQVSGRLFDGRSDPTRLIRLTVRDGAIVLPSIEDLIADRLGQHAVASASDPSRLEQARALFKMAQEIDATYARRRILEEGGDPALVGL